MARPAQLQIPLRTTTQFPFSSPIADEMNTPTYRPHDDSSSDGLSNPFDSPITNHGNPFADTESNTSGQDEFALEKYHNGVGTRLGQTAVGQSQLTKQDTGQVKANTVAKRLRPGLNVITNFSKARSEVDITRIAQRQGARREDNRVGQRAGTFVNLNDLKSLSKAREKERKMSTKKRKYMEREKKNKAIPEAAPTSQMLPTNDSKLGGFGLGLRRSGTLGGDDFLQSTRAPPYQAKGLQRSGTKNELSPSDRPIVIGISVPASESQSYRNQDSAVSQTTPFTPSIVITPADATDFLDHPFDTAPRRPASSIYSTATPYASTYMDAQNIPPVPAIPANHTYMGDKTNDESSSRAYDASLSANPAFGREETLLHVTRPRSLSNESSLLRDNRNSMDTLATRPRSKGWWNVMLSPFLSRSNTITSKRATGSPGTPPIPALPTDMEDLVNKSMLREKGEPTVRTPLTSTTQGSHSSCWTDWSEWERSLDKKKADEVEFSRRLSETDHQNTPPTEKASTDEILPTLSTSPDTQGLAAEYFFACAHDSISPVPYFECIGHSCADGTPCLLSDKSMDIDSNTEEGPRGVEEAERVGDPPYTNNNPNNPFFQVPSNRFSAAFREASSPRPRSESASTVFEDEPDVSPNVREADAATVVRARPVIDSVMHNDLRDSAGDARSLPASRDLDEFDAATPAPAPVPFEHPRDAPLPSSLNHTNGDTSVSAPAGTTSHANGDISVSGAPGPTVNVYQPDHQPQSTAGTPPSFGSPRDLHPEDEPAVPPPYSPPRRVTRFPRYVAVVPPDQQPHSPGPISPEMQRVMSEREGISMTSMGDHESHTPAPYGYQQELPPRPYGAPIGLADIHRQGTVRQEAEARRQRYEKEDAIGRKFGGLWRGRGCFSDKGCFGRGGREGRTRRRWYILISTALFLMIILIVVLAIKLTRKGDHTPVQSQWLNLTGYPPMPTGISTVARPDNVVANTGCVSPSTMWSCAVPKEDQAAISPNDPDQPNFRIEIRFRNGSFENSTAVASNSTSKRSISSPNHLSAGQFLKRKVLDARDIFTDELYTSSPTPPSTADQIFLGNTTDEITEPFNGESTPFYITMLPTSTQTTPRLAKRDTTNSTSNGFPDLASAIPDPSVDSDGTAAAATLLPTPSSQPVRLYNRGLSTEHYGFYTYFDKSIFLKSTEPLNGTSDGTVPDDENGGSTKSEASVRCTWAQTRFLVQIWTKGLGNNMALLPELNNTSSSSTSSLSSSSLAETNSSATDFSRPGSFPYPVTFTLDRHGGNEDKKMVYCYGMNDREQIVDSEKKLQLEFRGFGGTLINPASGVFNISGSDSDDSYGGVDGGTGGCKCQWQNWESSA